MTKQKHLPQFLLPSDQHLIIRPWFDKLCTSHYQDSNCLYNKRFDKWNFLSLKEKPQNPLPNWICTGLIFYIQSNLLVPTLHKIKNSTVLFYLQMQGRCYQTRKRSHVPNKSYCSTSFLTHCRKLVKQFGMHLRSAILKHLEYLCDLSHGCYNNFEVLVVCKSYHKILVLKYLIKEFFLLNIQNNSAKLRQTMQVWSD